MASGPKNIRVISDGRPGHENQSVGLATAIARRTGATVETFRIPAVFWLPPRCRAAVARPESPPDLIIGAGHKVHLPLLYAARRFRAKSVVIMKPTWPQFLFDLCILPQHDEALLPVPGRVIRTFGALNRLPETAPVKQPKGLILVGGPSRAHGWDGANVARAVAAVLQTRSDLAWTISDSRRTPAGFLDQLRQLRPTAEVISHSQTAPDWLPGQLMAAAEAWVTEDSISMIFEAVTAGARTGILPVPARQRRADPVRAIRQLVHAGYAMDFEVWQQKGRQLPPAKRLHETGRCADLVLAQLFPG